MKTLKIYPSFLCPFSCSFCYFKNSISLNEFLSLESLKEILSNNKSNIKNIIITGGEPMNLPKEYFNNLIDLIKQYNTNITVESYPYTLSNYRDDIKYNFSYDFMIRPRAMDVWENLLRFPQKFDLTITLSPLMFRYHPNALLQKLSLLPNVQNVEFIPYFKNKNSQFDITKNQSLDKLNKLILSSKLNIPFTLINKEKLRSKILGIDISTDEVCIFPNGKLYYPTFENEIYSFIETTNDIFVQNTTLIYPDNIDMYSAEIVQWSKENGI